MTNIRDLASLVVAARDIHEASFVPEPKPFYGSYAKSWDEATDEALANAAVTDADIRDVVWFLAISGEGSDICRGILARRAVTV